MFKPGLVHTPVTPFDAEGGVDYDTFGRLIAFHIANGADALAVPMHVGEAVSLPDAEKRELIAFAVREAGATPVIAHASDSGSGLAASLARFAEESGAAAIVTAVPYYWTPPPAMLVEHFATVANAVSIPFYVHNAPEEMAGIKVTVPIALDLLKRADNFAGLVDSGLDWQFMIELVTEAPKRRPDFQLASGVEYMVSAGAIGARSLFSPLAAIAPRLVRALHEACAADRLSEIRTAQEDVAALRQVVKPHGIAGLKAAARLMGRDCGIPRPPLQAPDAASEAAIAAGIEAIASLGAEPRGW